MQLCLQFENVLGDLSKQSGLKQNLALPITLAARSFDAGLAKGMERELDVLQSATDRIIEHLEGGLVSARLAPMAHCRSIAHIAQTLLLLCCSYLLLQVLAL